MKKLVSIIYFFGFLNLTLAQVVDSITLSKSEVEALFLKNNIDLISQKLKISQAEARLVQSKFWPNPTLTVDEVNLWRTWDIEKQPALLGNWGTNSQIAVEIEQVIQTAGKRRKSIELAQIEVEGEQFEFQEVLRELKKDLRDHINEILLNQEKQQIVQSQISSISKLTKAYQNQFNQGNISKAEYIRLKAQEMEFKKDLITLQQEMQEEQTEVKSLLMLSPKVHLKISDKLETPKTLIAYQNAEYWFELAEKNRPDILLNRNEEKSAQKNVELQNAMKTPDLAFKVGYDRGGNIMKDFVGLGVAFDLPVFDRNKGNIQDAKLEVEKKALATKKTIHQSQNEITSAVQNYLITEKMSKELEGDYEDTMDKLLLSYEKNFRARNITMLEYMDFLETYINNKNIILETQKELNDQLEQLQYVIGQDL